MKRFLTGVFLMLVGAGASAAVIARKLPSDLKTSTLAFLCVAGGACLTIPNRGSDRDA